MFMKFLGGVGLDYMLGLIRIWIQDQFCSLFQH